MLLVESEPWMARAECQAGDPESWHPDKAEHAAEAKAVCARCCVQRQCLEFAMAQEGEASIAYRFGVWGGLSARERYELWRQRRGRRVA